MTVTKRKKDTQINLFFTSDDAAMLKEMAESKGLSLSTMIRNWTLQAAKHDQLQNTQWLEEGDRQIAA
jgi:uncharacterized protein (DUF1778 family)